MARLMSTPVRAVRDFPAFATLPSTLDPDRLIEGAGLLDRWRAAIRQALASNHLVDVAFELGVTRGWRLATLEKLGVPTDLLDCFPGWRLGSRTSFTAGTAGLRLAPSGAAVPLGTLRLQLSPTAGTIAHALRLLRDLLRQLDQATTFMVVVEPGANVDALTRLVERFGHHAGSRVRFAAMRTITVFAQDNGRAGRDANDQHVLLVPREFRAAGARAEDELRPFIAERVFNIHVRRSRLYWEGGNIVQDSARCFVGVDTIAENTARLGLTNEEVIALFESEFGMPVAPLGRLEVARYDALNERLLASGQAAFHIDLDVSLLGRYGRARAPRALVADPACGLDFVDTVLATRRLVHGHFLPAADIRRHLRAEYEAHATARHPLLLEYASSLAALGYRIVGMPDLRVEPAMDVFARVNLDFGYCNVLPGLKRARPAVHYFPSGIAELDIEAARRLRLAGVDPVPVCTADVASALMLLQGGLHCCCGSI
jgi:GGDEF domain-containing protein